MRLIRLLPMHTMVVKTKGVTLPEAAGRQNSVSEPVIKLGVDVRRWVGGEKCRAGGVIAGGARARSTQERLASGWRE